MSSIGVQTFRIRSAAPLKLRHCGHTAVSGPHLSATCCGPIEDRCTDPSGTPSSRLLQLSSCGSIEEAPLRARVPSACFSRNPVAAPLKRRLALVYGEHRVRLPQPKLRPRWSWFDLVSERIVQVSWMIRPRADLSAPCGTRLKAGRGARFCNLRAAISPLSPESPCAGRTRNGNRRAGQCQTAKSVSSPLPESGFKTPMSTLRRLYGRLPRPPRNGSCQNRIRAAAGWRPCR